MKKVFSLLLLISLFYIPSPTFAQLKVPILVYHSIDEFKGTGQKELYVTPENFEKQMEYLKATGYTLLTFEQWEDLDKVDKPIFITFDDGYKNNLNAFTTFQKLQDSTFKPAATIFVISDFIAGPKRLSHFDLKNLSDSGLFSIQSHTATHPDLTKTENITYELKASKDKIEKITGKPVIALSYPFGSFNPNVVNETKKHYRSALTTTPGIFIKTGQENENYLLPRIYVKYSTTIEEFAKRFSSN